MPSLKAIGTRVLDMLDHYTQMSRKGETPVLPKTDPASLAGALDLERWIRKGGLDAETAARFLTPYLEASQHLHHPGFIGHQVATPHTGSVMADLVNGVINNPMAVYEMGPSATLVEKVVVNWMLQKAGWFGTHSLSDFTPRPGTGTGILTHGGSLANLTALLAARAAAVPAAWEAGVPDNLALIAPSVTHYSMTRAASIAGLGQQAVIAAPTDDLGVLRPENLEATYQQACDDGRHVFMASLNACATATGLYDPIDEVADFCAGHDLWLHVDGAHGASTLLSAQDRHRMKGISRADSLTWDAHKMLRTSALCAAILFKDPQSLNRAFSQDGSYIFYDESEAGFDLGRTTIECTKAALGTKLFWVLAMEGEEKLGDYVHKQYRDTRDFYELIAAQDDFECPYVPQSNILCFRYLPCADNDAQMALRTKIIESGKFYITTTLIKETRYLRLSVMNPLTSLKTIKDLLATIRDCAAAPSH